MDKSWFVETHGDPLGAIQHLIATTWEEFDLDRLMVSMNGNSQPDLIDDPGQLDQVNPFRPLMTKNSAKYIPQLLEDSPDSRLGVILRPCEMRALIEMQEREQSPSGRLLTICVDCLGTYPREDYQWRAKRKGSSEQLANESLHFARQGGIASYRFRSACQACRSPISSRADINIGVIGLPVRQKILIDASDQVKSTLLAGGKVSAVSDQDLLEQREYIIAKLLQRGAHTRQRLADNLETILPRNVDALITQFESCGECRECFSSCPLCTANYPARDEFGKYHRDQVKEWMISCAGCGMCEQACPNHLPLVTIFSHLREMLIQERELIH
ncbi:MAG: Coenzyme F420 hydrogenase/dehydrogenase, beta subunit C-terminal domain [Anaerolineales bacterium]